MFSHVMVGANDLDASKTFYDAVLGALGYEPGVSLPKDRAFWNSPTGMFCVGKPLDGEAATHANGGTVGFACDTTEKVDAWHQAGIAAGGTACEEPPGIRTDGLPFPLYLAYLRDPAGNKLCAMKAMID